MPPESGWCRSLRNNPTKRGELNRRDPIEIFALKGGYMLMLDSSRGKPLVSLTF